MATKRRFTVKHMGAIILLVIVVVMFNPIGLPISVSAITKDFYNEILKLKQGDTVMWCFESSVIGAYTDIKTAMRAVAQTIAKQKANIVFTCVEPFTPIQMLDFLPYSGIMAAPYNYVYGTNVVVMPYVAGEETALAAIAANFKATYTADAKGTPISQIPLLQPINTLNDFKLAVIKISIFTFADMFIRQWPAKYGIRTITMCTYSIVGAYYGSYVFGCLDLVRGNAEFEKLTGILGEEIIYMDIRNINCGITLALIAISNITLYMYKGKKEEVKA